MGNRFFQKSAGLLRTYTVWTAILLLFSFCLRIVEYVTMARQVPETNQPTIFFFGLLNDAAFALSICFLLFFPLLLLWGWKPRVAGLAFSLTGSLFLLAAAGLSRYYLTTKTLLGADLFGYSLNDIRTTLGSSTSFAPTDLLPLVLVLLFLLALRHIRKKNLTVPAGIAAVLLVTGLGASFRYNAFVPKKGTAAGMLSLSKAAWFVTANLSGSRPSAPLRKIDEYPLLHNDKSPAGNPQQRKPQRKENKIAGNYQKIAHAATNTHPCENLLCNNFPLACSGRKKRGANGYPFGSRQSIRAGERTGVFRQAAGGA